MLKHFLPVLSLSLLPACAADATPDGPSASSTAAVGSVAEGAMATVTVEGIIATDTSLTFDVAYSGAPALEVVLTGPTGATTLTNQTSSVAFTGLTSCTAYTYSFQYDGATLASGQVSTHYTGNVVCPAVESVVASNGMYFQGFEHQGSGETYGGWPDGAGWRFGITGSLTDAEFGYIHYSGDGESMVHVYRQELNYVLPDSFWARGVTNVTLVASVDGLGNGGGKQCITAVRELSEQPWPQNQWGGLWAPIMAAPESDEGLAWDETTTTYPVVQSGASFSVDFGTPVPTSKIFAGFESDNDGYMDQNANFAGPSSYANDNSVCVESISSIALNVTLADLPPDTPIHCTEAIDCNTYTVTCANAPDYFTLYRLPNAEWPLSPMVTVQGTTAAGGTVTMTDVANGPTYQVCTQTSPSDATQICVQPTITSNVACPPAAAPPKTPISFPTPPKRPVLPQ